MSNRFRGVIKRYFSNRDFGFVCADGEKSNLFFHVTDCLVDDDDLIGGRRVEFEEGRARDGRRIAKSVMLIKGERLDGETGKAANMKADAGAWWVSRTSAMSLGRDHVSARMLALWLDVSIAEMLELGARARLPWDSFPDGVFIRRRDVPSWLAAIRSSPEF